MELDRIQNILVILASSTTLLGIPVLLFIIHRIHRIQTRSISPFVFPDAEELISSLKESHARIKNQLEQQLSSLKPSPKEEAISAIEFRLSELQKIKNLYERVKAHQGSYLETWMEGRVRRKEDRYILQVLYANHNVETCSKVLALVDELIQLEYDLQQLVENTGVKSI